VIGGDTIFTADFDLDALYKMYLKRSDNLVLTYNVQDTTKYGIAELDKNNIVISFLEKPQLFQTTSRTACPCFYFLRLPALKLLQQYVAEAKSLQEVDAPGTFIAWLYSRSPLYASPVRRRFDIGTLPTYIEADNYYNGIDGEKVEDEKVKMQRSIQSRRRRRSLQEEEGGPKGPGSGSNTYVVLGLLAVAVVLIKFSRL